MSDCVDSFEHAGLEVRIVQDFDPEFANPRQDDGSLGVMFCAHSRYSLGDKNAPDPRDSERDIVTVLREDHGARVILPLFLYDHSGITISAGGRLDTGEDDFNRSGRYACDSRGWDVSSVGVIFDTAETRKACGQENASDEEIERQLREEVKYYAAYLEGSVFGFEVYAPLSDDDDDEEPYDCLDSCYGFLEVNVWADDAYVRQEAREAAEWRREALRREAEEAARWACADVITVEV